MTRACYVGAAVLLFAAAAGAAAERSFAEKVSVEAPAGILASGREHVLTVRLTDQAGRTRVLPRSVNLVVKGGGELRLPASVPVARGSDEVRLRFTPPRPGVWTVEVGAPGLGTGAVTVVAVPQGDVPAVSRPAVDRDRPGVGTRFAKRVPAGRASPPAAAEETRTAAGPPAGGGEAGDVPRLFDELEVTAVPAGGAVADTEAGPSEPERGTVRLYAQPDRVRRSAAGWPAVEVLGVWMVDGMPRVRHTPLRMRMMLGPESSPCAVAPSESVIDAGQVTARPVAVVPGHAGTAVIAATYDGGWAEEARVSFLPPEPAALVLPVLPGSVAGLATAEVPVVVRAVDESGAPCCLPGEVRGVVTASGPSGTVEREVVMAAESGSGSATFSLARHGTYTFVARAGTLPCQRVTLRYTVDWLLIGMALFGGVIGSGSVVLQKRRKPSGRTVFRIVAIGLVAAVVVLLLASFGLLSAIEASAPQVWGALASVPAASLMGALLLGIVAGLGGEGIVKLLGGKKE